MRGMIIETDGSYWVSEFEDSYEFISTAVGGFIELVPARPPVPGIDVWCNEEGKLLNLPRNEAATQRFGAILHLGDYLAGPVVVTGGADSEGVTQGLSDEQVAQLEALFAGALRA